MNGKLLIATNHFDSIVYSDASEEGYASFEVSLKYKPIRGIWTAHEKKEEQHMEGIRGSAVGVSNPPKMKWPGSL